jgi:predicted esterase
MKRLRYIIAAGLLAGLGFALWGMPRPWTSLDSKPTVADSQTLENETHVPKKGSQADVRAQNPDAEPEHDRSVQDLLGVNNHVSIAERRWDHWEDYYTESVSGKKMMEFFATKRSIVDVPRKGVFVSVEHAVRPPDYAPTMVTYCPSDYDGQEKLGVYIHISPGSLAVSPNPGYQVMMDKHRLVYAAPDGTSNNESDMRRCALALDALAQLRKDYHVDENRVYIGGTSGGGAESTFATFLYPQDFRAAFNSVRGFQLTSSSCLPFADESDIRTASKNQQPFAFISGPEDFCYKSMPGSEQNFRDHGFVVRFFDIPGMRHQTASPETFDQVMEWVEANNPWL